MCLDKLFRKSSEQRFDADLHRPHSSQQVAINVNFPGTGLSRQSSSAGIGNQRRLPSPMKRTNLKTNEADKKGKTKQIHNHDLPLMHGLQNDLDAGVFRAHNLMNRPPPRHAGRVKKSKGKVEHTISISANQPEDSDSDINILKTDKKPQKKQSPRPSPSRKLPPPPTPQRKVSRKEIPAPVLKPDVTQESVHSFRKPKSRKEVGRKTPKKEPEPKSGATALSAYSKKIESAFGAEVQPESTIKVDSKAHSIVPRSQSVMQKLAPVAPSTVELKSAIGDVENTAEDVGTDDDSS